MSEASIIDWLMTLPLSVGIIMVGAWLLIQAARQFLDFLAKRQNPEEALREDLMTAYSDMRAEIKELRLELNVAYEKVKLVTSELNSLREGMALLKVELHTMKSQFPEVAHVFHTVIEKIDKV